MKTRFIYLILSPTNPGADVFFSKSIKIEYEDSELKDKIDEELNKLLDFCNHPVNYVPMASKLYTTLEECETDRSAEVTNYKANGYNVKEIDYKSPSFTEVNSVKIIKAAELKEFMNLLPPFNSATVCDPKGQTYLTMLGYGRGMQIKIHGQWRPGREGHQFWGPTGDGSQIFNGMNKWAAAIVVTDFYGSLVGAIQYPGHTITISGTDPSWNQHVYVVMNDDIYDDNYNKDDDPMTVEYILY